MNTIAAALRLWLPASRARRRSAAMATLVGTFAFDGLPSAERARVDAELINVFKPFGIYPWWTLRRREANGPQSGERAIAMSRLGLSTGLPDLSWKDVLHPWHRDNPAHLHIDFRPFGPETDDALKFLESRGFRLPKGVHVGKAWLQSARQPTQTQPNDA